jgi:hypothetical protein
MTTGFLRYVTMLTPSALLPLALSNLIYAGYGGQGVPCDLCDLPILADEIEYDVTDPRDDGFLHFHIAYHFTWQRECALRLRD